MDEPLTQDRLNHMETGPLTERRVSDRRRVPDRRRVKRRASLVLMPAHLNRRQGLDRRIINRRAMTLRSVAVPPGPLLGPSRS